MAELPESLKNAGPKDYTRVAHVEGLNGVRLENQNGPLERLVLTLQVHPLFPGSAPTEVATLQLVLDDLQVTRLRDLLNSTELDPRPGLAHSGRMQ